MTNRLFTVLGISLLATVFAIAQESRTIEVNVVYTGAGKVDASHKIYVALWNSANMDAAPPAEVQSLDSKTGIVTFKNVQVPAYVSTAYDPSGKWDAQSPPPSGSSVGMYSRKPPTPDPVDVAPGKTTRITVTFNDSTKVP
jgi:hypothetical protein